MIEGLNDTELELSDLEPTKFVGFDTLESDATVVMLLDRDGNKIDELKDDLGFVIFDTTPFFALGGGQESDNGCVVKKDNSKLPIVDLRKDIVDGIYIHEVNAENNVLNIGDKVHLLVNDTKREQASQNHSALHITWSTLHTMLNEDLPEVGSKLNDEKYQIQFEPDWRVTEQFVMDVVNKMNADVFTKDIKTKIYEISEQEAKDKNYLLDFTKVDKGENVRMVEFPGVGLEPCSGTHITSTNEITKVYYLNYDRNKKRVSLDLTTNYAFAKNYFDEKIIAKVREIETLEGKIKNLKPDYIKTPNLADFEKEENWNYLSVQKLNQVFNDVTKTLNTLAKEEQKRLAKEFEAFDFNEETISNNNKTVTLMSFNDERITDKIVVSSAMKMSRDYQTNLFAIYNEALKNLIIVSNDKALDLKSIADNEDIYNKFDLKGGGSPKMLTLTLSDDNQKEVINSLLN
ncbi:alanine--tRNA ligase-related protein [Mesoplasma lactucae]|uniref:Uncharacterized protein n=1 Tax=Mesoplasma lactucae ATCC 49193 TaxID=81460 RepID=A0A291ISB0_9MOLU|nr:alanine--tRNA ligase-related protein [Mesoplasma lactucae]ATG97634.1 hypothetical protein CP520_02735 [Mesoplasma lactucae ATCC 49193]MCL8216769.1 hypothetical protein [Mesoplasma lactucae ATCC 49193]